MFPGSCVPEKGQILLLTVIINVYLLTFICDNNSIMVKQFCCVCTRARGAGHPPPFGKNCTMPPLATPERKKNLDEQQKLLAEIHGLNYSDEDNNEDNSDIDSDAEFAAQEEMLKQQKELLLKKKEEATKRLARDRKLMEKCEQVKKMREELLKISEEVQSQLQESDSIQMEIRKELPGLYPDKQRVKPDDKQKPPPGQPAPEPGNPKPADVPSPAAVPVLGQQAYGVPGVVPAVHNYPGARPKIPGPLVPPAAAAAALDPVHQAYGQAYAAYAPGQQAVPPQVAAAPVPGPGAGHQAFLQQNPLLGAAAGIAAAPSTKSSKLGKCLPEYYIEQSASLIDEAEKSRPSFYEFMHGVMTLLVEKHVKNGEPIDDLLLYYQQITNFTTSQKWYAVYNLHVRMSKEVAIGMRGWADEITYNKTFKHFNVESDLSYKKSGSHGNPSNNAKPRPPPPRPRAQSERPTVSGGGHINEDDDRPICRNYNFHARGCRYGADICNFRHECRLCDDKGVRVVHPGMFCPNRDGKSKDGAGGK